MKSFLAKLSSGLRMTGRKIVSFMKAHKVWSVIILLAIVGAGFWGYNTYAKSITTTQYVLAAATNEPIESTVTASGEVASEHQLDLSAKASGEITGVYVKAGDTVKAGQVIAQVDSTDAQKSLRDAEANYTSAQISYTQSIASANNSVTNSQTSLSTARDNGFDAVASAENDLDTVIQGLDTLLHGPSDVPGLAGQPTASAYVSIIKDTEPSAESSRETAIASYNAAVDSYQQTFALYQAASRTSSPEDIEKLLRSEQETATKVNQAVKDSTAFFTLVNTTVTNHSLLKQPPSIAAQITTLASYTSKANSDASSVANALSSLASAQQSVDSNTASISGGTPLSVQSAQLALTKAQNSLQDAKDALADYTVTAPFSGTIGTVSLQKYDQASGKIATLITDQQYANISLNETDISNVKIGQKATLTLDAIDGLTMNGTVAEVDQIGTVSQGVATYSVKVGFDTTDDRVLPGMTVNATIITASKDSALVVPTSAIKTQGDEKYVEVATRAGGSAMGSAGSATSSMRMRGGADGGRTATSTFARMNIGTSSAARFGSTSRAGGTFSAGTETVPTDSVTIRRVPVTTGIESDTMVEITSGLAAGEQVVTQSLNASGKSTASSGGLFGLLGGNRAATRTTTGAAGAARSTSGNATFRAGGAAGGATFTRGAGAPPGGGG